MDNCKNIVGNYIDMSGQVLGMVVGIVVDIVADIVGIVVDSHIEVHIADIEVDIVVDIVVDNHIEVHIVDMVDHVYIVVEQFLDKAVDTRIEVDIELGMVVVVLADKAVDIHIEVQSEKLLLPLDILEVVVVVRLGRPNIPRSIQLLFQHLVVSLVYIDFVVQQLAQNFVMEKRLLLLEYLVLLVAMHMLLAQAEVDKMAEQLFRIERVGFVVVVDMVQLVDKLNNQLALVQLP